MTLRPVSIESRPMVQPDGRDVEPRLTWLPISRLVIDERYQRPLMRANWLAINKIAANFRWHRFTPVLASPIEGADTYALIDGQHRAHAAALAGFAQVPAMVVDLTFEEQASSFSWINGQVTAMTPFNKFKAALCAGDAIAVEADTRMRATGARMMTSQPSAVMRKPRVIYCIALVLKAVSLGRGVDIERAVRAVHDSTKADEVWYWGFDVLDILLHLLHTRKLSPEIDISGFVSATNFKRLQHGASRMMEQPKYASRTRKSLYRDLVSASLDAWLAETGAT